MSKSRVVPFCGEYWKLAECFHCGNIHIDNFLRSGEALNGNVCRTYVYLNDDATEIIGFYSISTGCVELEDAGLLLKIGGSIHITDFALDEKYHGWEIESDGIKVKLSDVLLIDCIDRIKELQTKVGFAFITLNATNEGYSLYKRNSFDEIEEDMHIPNDKKETDCIPMYFALEVV